MSEATIRGTITNFSPKPNKNYYGLRLDTDQHGMQWYNGSGNPKDKWSKGDKVKLKVNKDEFIDIQDIIFPESGASEADGSRGSDSDKDQSYGGSTGSDSYFSKDDRINKKVAFKEAAETLRAQEEEVDLNHGEHIEALAGLANGYYNILKELGGDE